MLRFGHRQVRARGVARPGTETRADVTTPRRRRDADTTLRPAGTATETKQSWGSLPPGARLGLPVLDQGAPVVPANWDALVSRVQERLDAPARPAGAPPDCYVSYVVEPRTIEFYSGGHAGFMNDRWLYVRDGDAWRLPIRLQP